MFIPRKISLTEWPSLRQLNALGLSNFELLKHRHQQEQEQRPSSVPPQLWLPLQQVPQVVASSDDGDRSAEGPPVGILV
jgi:hypothetical protein